MDLNMANGTSKMSQQPISIPTASLQGQVAIVTGGSRGIGKGCAIELARRGANVVVNYVKNKETAEETVKEIEATGTGAKAVAIQADLSKVPEIDRLFVESKKHFGKINIVFSNSGHESWDEVQDITEEKYETVFNLNTRAQLFVGQATWNHAEDNARLILMSSISAGSLGIKNHALYNASKMAVYGIVTAFAADFGSRGITVNGVAPGGVLSDMFTENAWHYVKGTPDTPAEEVKARIAAHSPLGRCAVPDDVARVVCFLASGDGGWINGQILKVTGGANT